MNSPRVFDVCFLGRKSFWTKAAKRAILIQNAHGVGVVGIVLVNKYSTGGYWTTTLADTKKKVWSMQDPM